MSSEDIRKQLPVDSDRFDRIDTDFKILMDEMSKRSNVVESTNRAGLCERLEGLQKELVLCEKALAEYLETKRLAFPRFYFVSSADLLDILSNGTQPEFVVKHLTKLFDSIAKLKFRTATEEQPSLCAVGMIAKDSEYVDFNELSEIGGPVCLTFEFYFEMIFNLFKMSVSLVFMQVEVWLNRIQSRMRSTLRILLSEAVSAYEEKPRDQWLFDYPAQVSLCGTQIWWTTEVNLAFERLEEVNNRNNSGSSFIAHVWALFVCKLCAIIQNSIFFAGLRQQSQRLYGR